MKYIIDSYAWVEYLDGGSKGKIVNDILAENDEIYTLSLTITEVISRVKRKNSDANLAYEVIVSNSEVLGVTREIAKEAGFLHAAIREKIKDFGIVDSLILITAKKLNAKIVTGDPHFKGFKEAIFLS